MSDESSGAARVGSTGELSVQTTHKQNGAVQYEERSEDARAAVVGRHPAVVEFGVGRTLPTAPFESVSVRVGATMPCAPEDLEKTYEQTVGWVLEKFVSALEDIENFVQRSARNRHNF